MRTLFESIKEVYEEDLEDGEKKEIIDYMNANPGFTNYMILLLYDLIRDIKESVESV